MLVSMYQPQQSRIPEALLCISSDLIGLFPGVRDSKQCMPMTLKSNFNLNPTKAETIRACARCCCSCMYVCVFVCV